MSKKIWTNDDLYWAYLQVINFLENEETSILGDEGTRTIAGYKEAAKRIRKMAERLRV